MSNTHDRPEASSSDSIATSPPHPTSNSGPSIVRTCLSCRKRHIKCDGMKPCSRCKRHSLECVYPARRPRSGAPRTTALAITEQPHNKTCALREADPTPAVALTDLPLDPILDQLLHEPLDVFPLPEGPASKQPRTLATTDDRYIDAFYFYFYSSHPFVLPKDRLLRLRTDQELGHLLAAIQWIGSLYLGPRQVQSSLFEDTYQLAHHPAYPKNGFMVQALMLLVIGLDGVWKRDDARRVLADAEAIALDISLNSRDFTIKNSLENEPVQEESWRRTWWELFVLDGLMAGVHRSTNFPLFDVSSDVALPCEEFQYLSGDIREPVGTEALEDQEFSNTSNPVSSFAYRIQAVRILGSLIHIPRIHGAEDINISRIESALTNWRLHLPASKRQCLREDGTSDQMMFQAYMIIHTASILLHLPHSQIRSNMTPAITSCAPCFEHEGTGALNTHTQHAAQSASEISTMITYPEPLLMRTPFFCCAITLSTVVHLGRALSSLDGEDTRQQVRLNLGALAEMAKVWGVADESRRQILGLVTELRRKAAI